MPPTDRRFNRITPPETAQGKESVRLRGWRRARGGAKSIECAYAWICLPVGVYEKIARRWRPGQK